MLIGPLTPEIIGKRRVLRRKVLSAPGRFWRRTRRGLAWTIAIGFALHCALNIYSSVLLNRELAAIRKKGEPLQFAELAPPTVPDAQNAARLYAQATKALHFSREDEIAVSTRQNDRTPQQKKAAQAALSRNQRALDLAQRAGLMPKCRFTLDYDSKNLLLLPFPHYGELRRLARFVGARAAMSAEKGDIEAALRDVRAVFGMAHHLGNEPILIGFLVAQVVDSLANQALSEVLEATPVTLAQTSAFQEALPKTDWNRAYQHCLIGERTVGIVTFESSRRLNGLTLAEISSLTGEAEEIPGSQNAKSPWLAPALVLLWRPLSKLDEVQTLRLWKQVLDLSSTSKFQPSTQSMDPISQAVDNVPKYAVLTRILFPVFVRSSENRDRAEVRRRQREIALLLAVYRVAEGSPAYELEELAGFGSDAIFLDPYSKKPFVYRLDKDGKNFTLYSIGPNRKDDGGVRESFGPSINIGADDIVWGASKRTASQ